MIFRLALENEIDPLGVTVVETKNACPSIALPAETPPLIVYEGFVPVKIIPVDVIGMFFSAPTPKPAPATPVVGPIVPEPPMEPRSTPSRTR